MPTFINNNTDGMLVETFAGLFENGYSLKQATNGINIRLIYINEKERVVCVLQNNLSVIDMVGENIWTAIDKSQGIYINIIIQWCDLVTYTSHYKSSNN